MRENVCFDKMFDTLEEKFNNLYLILFCLGDQCPMYFDDGAYPWETTENYIKIFNWDFIRSSSNRQIAFINYLSLFTCLSILRMFIY